MHKIWSHCSTVKFNFMSQHIKYDSNHIKTSSLQFIAGLLTETMREMEPWDCSIYHRTMMLLIWLKLVDSLLTCWFPPKNMYQYKTTRPFPLNGPHSNITQRFHGVRDTQTFSQSLPLSPALFLALRTWTNVIKTIYSTWLHNTKLFSQEDTINLTFKHVCTKKQNKH